MKKIETVQDFRQFLNINRDKLIRHAVRVEELPSDDEWIQDDNWDELYKKEITGNGKV